MPFAKPIAVFMTLFLVAAVPATADPAATTVFKRIAERLSLMKPVAAWKRARDVAVEDLAREAVVLEKVTAGAKKQGLSAETTKPFFEAQIVAAKDIQTCWIARWDKGQDTPPDPVPDLKSDIRPKLLTIGAALIADVRSALEAGVAFETRFQQEFAGTVALDCLSDEARDRIYSALGAIRLVN